MSDKALEMQPYLQSREMYDDMYGNAESRFKVSVIINIVLSIALILSIGGLISLGGKVKHIPYLVSTDGLSARSLGPVMNESLSQDKKKALSRYFITQFIKKMRDVSVDGAVEQQNIESAYSFARGASLTNAINHFKKQNPFELAKESITSVEKFNYVMPISENTIKAKWLEVVRNSQTGDVLKERVMVGEFLVEWDTPSQSLKVLKANPLGFYVKNYSWSEEQV